MPPHLTFGIQVGIIKRLPVRSLMQFRSVCKAWKSLIDSSDFIAGYQVRRDQPQHLMINYGFGTENGVRYVCFVDNDTFPRRKYSLTIPHLARTTTVIGSSHGLLCLNGYLYEERYDSEMEIVLLWNPSIRKAIAVDVSVVDVTHQFPIIGFGVCPNTKDPKLVKITYSEVPGKMESVSSIPCQVMVFTLSLGEWTALCTNKLPPITIQFGSNEQTTMGQFIYWLAGRFYNLIMSFDLSTHEFREVELPDSLCKSQLSISRLRESLVLINYYNTRSSRRKVCDVWMMENSDSKALTKLFTIKAPNASIERTLGFRNNGEAIIAIHADDKDEDFHPQCAVVVYEPCSEHIKNLGIRGNKYSFSGSFYTDSLLLLNHDDGYSEA